MDWEEASREAARRASGGMKKLPTVQATGGEAEAEAEAEAGGEAGGEAGRAGGEAGSAGGEAEAEAARDLD